MIEKLVEQNNCLVVKVGDEYFVTESFDRTEYALKPNQYKNVVIGQENPYQLKDVFLEEDVLFFKWNNLQVLDLVQRAYSDIHELISASKDNYLLLSRLKILSVM